jgi:carbon monoxide dehydrogenase subunit G
VTAYEPASHYSFKVIAGPAHPVGEFQFAPVGDGTQVSFSLSAELSGIKKLFMSKPVQRAMDGEMASLDKAKALIEQQERSI